MNQYWTTTVEIRGKKYPARPWTGRRTDSYGNCPACDCSELLQVNDRFCVCLGRAYCPNHGGPRCVGGHD